jgi:hypothetical protein
MVCNVMQAQLVDGVIAQTKALLAAGPIPGIETYCVYGEYVGVTAALHCGDVGLTGEHTC